MNAADAGWWPDDHPELRPFAPFALAVWRDGVLTDEEHRVFSEHMAAFPGVSDEARAALVDWMDPDTPPTPRALVVLRRLIRSSEKERAGTPQSLTELGLALLSDGSTAWPGEQVDRMRALEDALGFGGPEPVHALLGRRATPLEPATATPLPAEADEGSAELAAWLAEPRGALRRQVLELVCSPDLRPRATGGMDMRSDAYRELVLAAVRRLADEGIGALAYPEEYGGAGDPGASVAAFESLAFGDLSVLVKFGVQFGLFGGSVAQLGTDRHHRAWLPRIGTLEVPGCYAMTETGHGSNVRDLETTARYDHERRELVVHTPSREAGKDWIGNAACHGRVATVFARLVVDDEDHGVHAMLVPIRDADGEVLPGVQIEDRGTKLGLNGVDNGRIWFDHVRIPVDDLLDRFARIDPDGRYQSPIPSDGRRFFTMLRTLVAGRVSIASASVSAAKTGLTVALRYTATRRQFGPSGGEEQPLLGYRTIRRALLPRLATTYGLHFATRMLQRRFESAAVEDDPELEVLAAGLKAYASDHCVETLQAAREACGGQGYLAENLFADLKADTDVFTTFEGANLVLLQLVAKGLLSRYREEMGDLNLRRALRYLGERAETSLTELNPVQTRRTDPEHLRDPSFHSAAFRYREERLLRSVALRIRSRIRDGLDSFEAVNQVQDHLVAVARAHTERVVLDEFLSGVERAPTHAREALERLAALYALSRLEEDRGWFLESGYLEGGKTRAIRVEVTRLCDEAATAVDLLVAGFGIPEALLPEIARTR